METTGRLFLQSPKREQFILLPLSNSLNQWRARRDSNPWPLPSEDCGSFADACIYATFRVQVTGNATKTSGDYADNLRTPPNVLCGFPLVVGMMMPINPL